MVSQFYKSKFSIRTHNFSQNQTERTDYTHLEEFKMLLLQIWLIIISTEREATLHWIRIGISTFKLVSLLDESKGTWVLLKAGSKASKKKAASEKNGTLVPLQWRRIRLGECVWIVELSIKSQLQTDANTEIKWYA